VLLGMDAVRFRFLARRRLCKVCKRQQLATHSLGLKAWESHGVALGRDSSSDDAHCRGQHYCCFRAQEVLVEQYKSDATANRSESEALL
jgi:hypothetical protein